MKLIIADDHGLIAASLESIINSKFSQIEILKVFNKDTLFNVLQNHTVDILIQDIRFGKDNAIDFIPTIIENYPNCKLIILTSITDPYTIKAISKFKPDAFILKTESMDTIVSALSAVISGQAYISKNVLEVNENLLSSNNKVLLSLREREILSQILMEKSIQQIAESLFISAKTVEMHRANLFVKLDVKNVTGLVKKAILYNLVDEL